MAFDRTVETLCKQFLCDLDWFVQLDGKLQQLLVDRCAEEVQQAVETATTFHQPRFRKYERPDDTQWAGWWEIDGVVIGYKGLDGSFVKKQEDDG